MFGWAGFHPPTDHRYATQSSAGDRDFSDEHYNRLEFKLTKSYLDYDEAYQLAVPPVPANQGVILSGKLPLWLWTALARVYINVPWLAVFQPQLERQAVVVASKDKDKPIGSLVSDNDPANGKIGLTR